jgi:beta-galactosidase
MRFAFLSLAALIGQAPFGTGLAIRQQEDGASQGSGRERIKINDGWRFQRFEENPDGLSYDALKAWILPAANNFIKDPANHHERPDTDGPSNVTYAEANFDDGEWEELDLPHDWAIKGPFYEGEDSPVSGGMGRLPSHGVGWYRRTISFAEEDEGKSIYLDVNGAMSYATVWLNGVIVGGWPYGYATFRLDLTPYLKSDDNQLAIRLDNAPENSRWYPGAGIYRDVWLTKVHETHIGQYGTFITSNDISAEAATLNLVVQVENSATSNDSTTARVETEVYEYDAESDSLGSKVGQFPSESVTVNAGSIESLEVSTTVENPKLWGPVPQQEPNLYIAVTQLFVDDEEIDSYNTTFGIRTIEYKGDGLFINGERIYIQGVCQHHDLGSLGAAFNIHAAERQLQMLQEMGSNSVRTSHNVPDESLLQLADKMGLIILAEIFDTWNFHKTPNDFQYIFADWSEPDLRSFIRRDRNHPSVWAWSYGNEVQEQDEEGGELVAQRLQDIVHEEDSTRLGSLGMNNAEAGTPFIPVVDMIGLNYQGEGKGYGAPTFDEFHNEFPDKMIFSTESSSVISSRGTYLFPVTGNSSTIIDPNGVGADPSTQHVSSYELYAVPWGASPDKVFAAQDAYPYVAGEYVWTGWDYIGEPTPYDSSRSSYFGIIDLAGFKKDRFYLYQARWNPEVPMAHILPHWNWPDRVGETTPVHVFSSADEAELFINGESQGKQQRGDLEYRFRWDDVKYEPGEVRVVTYKNGEVWAEETIRTTSEAASLDVTTYKDRTSVKADGTDLIFVSVSVVDENGDVVPDAESSVSFSIDGPGVVLTTDNGDQTDFNVFQETQRKAFSGKVLAIVRAEKGATGQFTVKAEAEGLQAGEVTISVE